MKLGGDKGGDELNTFKMNFQIVNVHNTCVFSCFEAGDSVTNLHSALDCFKDQVKQLQVMEWRYMYINVLVNGNKGITSICIQATHDKGLSDW